VLVYHEILALCVCARARVCTCDSLSTSYTVYMQHHTLACLSDVVDYFVAKVGPSARPLHIDPEVLMKGNQPSRAHSGAATLGRIPISRNTSSSSSSAFTQFVYSHSAVTDVGSTRSSLGSSGQSDTRSLSPPSPSDHGLNAAAAAAAAAAGGGVSVSNETHTATDNVPVNSTSQLASLLNITNVHVLYVCVKRSTLCLKKGPPLNSL